MPPCQILTNPWEQKESREERVWVGMGVGHYHHFVFIQKGGILLMQMFNENL
jgi:hypothetical protein